MKKNRTTADTTLLALTDELVHMLMAEEHVQALDILQVLQTHLYHIEQHLYVELKQDAP